MKNLFPLNKTGGLGPPGGLTAKRSHEREATFEVKESVGITLERGGGLKCPLAKVRCSTRGVRRRGGSGNWVRIGEGGYGEA